jgi:acetyltransferase-like isoleucine patch superfamily enzyme
MKILAQYKKIILINYLPFLNLLLLVGGVIGLYFADVLGWVSAAFALAMIYVYPIVVTRLIFAFLGKPNSRTKVFSPEFYAWWASLQMQMHFIRFPIFEEALRMIPGLYSFWLRCWGARIGKYTYWGARAKIMDRPFIQIGDYAVIGYGAGFTSHHFNMAYGKDPEFIFGEPVVGDYAIMGGMSGLAPGAEVAPGETLPSTLGLAPFYIWKEGRRHSL